MITVPTGLLVFTVLLGLVMGVLICWAADLSRVKHLRKIVDLARRLERTQIVDRDEALGKAETARKRLEDCEAVIAEIQQTLCASAEAKYTEP